MKQQKIFSNYLGWKQTKEFIAIIKDNKYALYSLSKDKFIKQRQAEGIKLAKEKGKRLGKPPIKCPKNKRLGILFYKIKIILVL